MSAPQRSYVGALILITLGILFLLDNLGVADFSHIISTYWPIILILVGLRIFFRYGRSEKVTSNISSATVIGGASQQSETPTIHHSNVFGDVDMKITSKDFRGGSISNVFGDMNIDLAEIQLADGEQILKLDGVFGDLHILIPKDIEISATTHSVFGDVRVMGTVKSGIGQEISYTSPNYSSATKKLRIYSNQVFGDVKVW